MVITGSLSENAGMEETSFMVPEASLGKFIPIYVGTSKRSATGVATPDESLRVNHEKDPGRPGLASLSQGGREERENEGALNSKKSCGQLKKTPECQGTTKTTSFH